MNSQVQANINLLSLQRLIFLEIEELEKYLDKIVLFARQNQFEKSPELEKLLKAIDSIEQETTSGLKFSFTSIHNSTHIVYHSAFLSVYSFFEYALKIVSQFVAFRDKVNIRKVNNMEKMYQYFDFLTEHIKLDRSIVEEEWRYLNIYKDIRNSIVHHNSTLAKNSSTISREFLETYPGIELKETGLFYFKNEQILVDLINTGRNFFIKLLQKIEAEKK